MLLIIKHITRGKAKLKKKKAENCLALTLVCKWYFQ